MATGALFGGSASRSQSKHLVEFRAGKMYMKGKMVHADKRKGLIYVHQTEADSLMHFCWKERSKSNAEEVNFPNFRPNDVHNFGLGISSVFMYIRVGRN